VKRNEDFSKLQFEQKCSIFCELFNKQYVEIVKTIASVSGDWNQLFVIFIK
jgi:hypothetical protein